MRRTLTLLTLAATLMLPVQAHATSGADNCRYGPTWTRGAVVNTIRCAEARWSAPGGLPMALCIARRESGLYPRAANPTSSALGLYQWLDSSWRAVYERMPDVRRWWNVGFDRTNPRNSAIVSMVVMHRIGLSPWGGGC